MIGPARLCLAAAAGVAAVCAPAVLSSSPRLIWNATASAPQGLYTLQAGGPVRVGDLVAVMPPEDLAAWLDAHGYLPRGALLIKRTAAVAPSVVCRMADQVTVDGVTIARAKVRDRAGRTLPAWSGCQRLGADDVFLINAAAGSLDSRYFGPLPRAAVAGRLTPRWLLTEHIDDH